MKVLSTLLALVCIGCAGSRSSAGKSPSSTPAKSKDMDQSTDSIPIPSAPEEITDENAATDNSASVSLVGVWRADCFADSNGFNSIDTIESNGVSGKRETIYYTDNTCTSVTDSWVAEYSKLTIGQKIPGTLSGNAVEIVEMNVTYSSLTLTILSQAELDRVVGLPDDYYFTDNELEASLNVPLDISGRVYATFTEPSKGSTSFGSLGFIDNKLYWTCCATTEQSRPTDLSPRIYKKIK
jgi:hypothetical protein